MTTEVRVSVSTNLDLLVNLSHYITITVDSLAEYFNSMTEWCVINLDEGTWEFSGLIKVNDSAHNEMVFARIATFSCPEDATAFNMRFGVISL